MKITRAGVDIAKSVFHVHSVDCHDKPGWQVKLKRSQWIEALCNRLAPGAEVGMEACASAHYWGRELHKRGFHVKLIAAQFVKPYVKSNKIVRNASRWPGRNGSSIAKPSYSTVNTSM